jgi:hypothetical protein
MSPSWIVLFLLAGAPAAAAPTGAPPDDALAASAENRSATRKRSDKAKPRPTTRSPERTARPATTRPPVSAPTNRSATTVTPRPPERRTEQARQQLRPVPPPTGTTRPYVTPERQAPVVSRTLSRPPPRDVRPHPRAAHPPPPVRTYRPYYTHWYVHPYYRYLHTSSVVVRLDFRVSPFDPLWLPPGRPGWIWVPGYWVYGQWYPGYWRPASHTAVLVRQHRYVFVPGWWQGPTYIEGWWRVDARPDWVWVTGRYLGDGTYVAGHWRPVAEGPPGYTWEPGFYDGQDWIDGFWRPKRVKGFTWIHAYFDGDGVYHAGYWEPFATKPGKVWIPGWFDGTTWNPGYWVDERDYREADPARYVPESDDGPSTPGRYDDVDDLPLALPAET